jgi:hypothetical protein
MAGNTTFPLGLDAPPESTADLGSTWSRIRHELVYLSFTVQEAALLAPLALVIMSWSRFWPGWLVFLWLLLLMLLPFNLIRLMGLLQWDRTRQQRVMVLAMLLTVFLSWRILLYEAASPFDFSWLRQFGINMAEGGNLVWTRDLSVFLFTLLAWWRGMRLAVKPLEISNAGLRLRVGGLFVAPVVAWLGTSFLTVSVVPFILLFFLASLTAVALVRAEQIEADRTGHAATLDPAWFLTVVAAGLGVVMVGGALAAFLSGESLFEVLSIFSPLWRALQFGGTVAAMTVFELLSPLLDALAAALQWLGELLAVLFGYVSEGLEVLAPNLMEQAPIPTPEATPDAFTAPAGLGKVVAAVLMLAVIGLIAWGLSRVYQQATFAARDSRASDPLAAPEEEPGLFDRLWQRLGLFQQRRAAASIRRIYENMCRAAAAAGYPRLEAETPYEYTRTLARAWPDHTADSRLITEAFIRIRYGELPETAEELEAIRAAWRRLESAEPQRFDQPTESAPTLEKRF